MLVSSQSEIFAVRKNIRTANIVGGEVRRCQGGGGLGGAGVDPRVKHEGGEGKRRGSVRRSYVSQAQRPPHPTASRPPSPTRGEGVLGASGAARNSRSSLSGLCGVDRYPWRRLAMLARWRPCQVAPSSSWALGMREPSERVTVVMP